MKTPVAKKKTAAKKTAPKKAVAAKPVVSKSVARRLAVQKAPAVTKNVFVVELILSYDTITGRGATIIEALEQFPARLQPKSRGTMLIKSPDGKVAQIQMQPVEVNRLFYKPINKVFFEKKMLSIMK